MDLAKKVEIFRSRFHGRQDVYGRARKSKDGSGKEKTVYSPVCYNIWTPDCHLGRGTGVTCLNCEHKSWVPVSDECVEQHIAYHHMHNFYLVLEDGAARLGVIDFDVKPGKEADGYDFFEVKKFCSILRAQGIAYGIARSTTAGYHVYMFFKEAYPAAKFRAVMYDFFTAAGFKEYVDNDVKPRYPEVFPAQDYVAQDGLGNGITPPMVEPLIMKGRKCFVDDEDRVIGGDLDGETMMDAQWSYLEALPWTDTSRFDQIIKEYNLRFDDIVTLKKRDQDRTYGFGAGTSQPYGHVEKVIFGCEAFRGLFQKIRDRKHHPSHAEGMSLWHLCINTVDGQDWFMKNVPTWGRDQTELGQLQYSIKRNYRPHSCSDLKEHKICHKDGLCGEAAPRQKTADPVNTDGVLEDLLPADQKKYNPYRYVLTEGVDLLHELIREADTLLVTRPVVEGETPPDEKELATEREEKLKVIIHRAQALDKKGLRVFREHIDRLQKKLKVPKNRIAPMFKAASEAHYDQEQELLREDTSVYEVGPYTYRKRLGEDRYGYFQLVKGKDSIMELLLLDSDIIVKEERFYSDDSGVTRTKYKGFIRNVHGEKSFEVDSDVWASDTEFQKYFTRLMGGMFSPVRKQIEHIKQAALGWCERRNLTARVSSLMTQGFYGEHYIMPSVTVDSSGLRETAEGVIDIGGKDFVKNLNWKILDDDVLIRTLKHLKDDFLSAWPEEWPLIGLAHTFRPLVSHVMNWRTFPTLFYDGLTGVGKSELARLLQQFWGRFDSVLNLTVSQKYMEEVCYTFKDAVLLFDDFKNLTPQQKNAVLHQIQYGYDGSSTAKLQRDSTPRESRRNRATIIMTGEEFIQNHSSVVARTLLVEVHRYDIEKTFEPYMRCIEHSKNYSGVTPRFLHWLLGRDKAHLQEECDKIRMALYHSAKGRQNASRIAENVSANHHTWKLFTSFLEDLSVISPFEREALDKRHWSACQNLYHRMVLRCEDEQESSNFKTILVSLILSGVVRVEGYIAGPENPRAPLVGYLPNPTDPKMGYYFPDSVMEAVNKALQIRGVKLSPVVVARQLLDLKIITSVDKGRLTKLVRKNGARLRVWMIDHEMLELVSPSSEAEDGPQPELGKVLNFRPAVQDFLDESGLC